MPNKIYARLLKWFDKHGRKNLPWQHPITPYRVWLSEIMLQQTQVDTVIPYFERFIIRFPSVVDLAEANIDEVLHLWTGLGYYARARNLHKCANTIIEQYHGDFPASREALEKLPGIGRSTAAAISSIAFEQPEAILDGNVKRVLARYHGVPGWPGKPAVAQSLWSLAEQHMPGKRCRDYTQAIMDLGATLCKRSAPDCLNCPVKSDCVAFAQGNPTAYPGKKPRKTLPVKAVYMIVICSKEHGILLQKRPPSGIWGGLWCLPEVDADDDCREVVAQRWGKIRHFQTLTPFRHTFSHYHLDITPCLVSLRRWRNIIREPNKELWYNIHAPVKIGLAAPVKKLLNNIQGSLPLFECE